MHKQENILFITDSFYPYAGGVEKHVLELSKKIIEDGHKITVLTFKKNTNDADTDNISGIKIYRLSKTNSKYSNFAGILYQIFSKDILKSSYDIIHYHDYSVFNIIYPILSLNREIRKKKTYITFHGWEGIYPVPDYIKNKRKYASEKTNGNICIGHFIEKWYGTRADIITYGAVEERKSDAGSDKTILYAGRLETDTGFPVLLEAFSEINKLHPEYKFVILGKGTLADTLKNYPNVIYKGWVKDTAEYISKSEVVFASGYLSMLEAFIQKKKVLGYYNNDLKKDYFEMIPHCRDLMWTAGSKDEIIRMFEEMFSNSEKVNAAYSFAKKYSWDSLKQDYYRLWNL